MTDLMRRRPELLQCAACLLLVNACGGKVIDDFDAGAQDADAGADAVGCAAVHDYDTCLWKSDAACGWGGPDECASMKNPPTPPVPPADVIHLKAEGCFRVQLCGTDNLPIVGSCPVGQTCRYFAVANCPGDTPCALNSPYDQCAYIHLCAGPNGP
jgi:hypothetical protein